MAEMINPGNHEQKSINECKVPEAVGNLKSDPPVPFCYDDGEPNLNRLHPFVDAPCEQMRGFGNQRNCDPMQSGRIRNDPENPDRTVIHKYTRAMRGANEAMLDLFSNIEVITVGSKIVRVPITWATYERAVAALLDGNVREDNSLVTDRIKLPAMSIIETGTELDMKRYCYHNAINWMKNIRPDYKPGLTIQEKLQRDTVFGVAKGLPINISYELNGWTWYAEDMYQICEQIRLKFSPVAYIKVRGVLWETIVKLDGGTNNVDTEPGEKQRVIKFKFNFTVETYIPQPIVRKKSVLKMNIDFFNSANEQEIKEVIDRMEIAIKELER